MSQSLNLQRLKQFDYFYLTCHRSPLSLSTHIRDYILHSWVFHFIGIENTLSKGSVTAWTEIIRVRGLVESENEQIKGRCSFSSKERNFLRRIESNFEVELRDLKGYLEVQSDLIFETLKGGGVPKSKHIPGF